MATFGCCRREDADESVTCGGCSKAFHLMCLPDVEVASSFMCRRCTRKLEGRSDRSESSWSCESETAIPHHDGRPPPSHAAENGGPVAPARPEATADQPDHTRVLEAIREIRNTSAQGLQAIQANAEAALRAIPTTSSERLQAERSIPFRTNVEDLSRLFGERERAMRARSFVADTTRHNLRDTTMMVSASSGRALEELVMDSDELRARKQSRARESHCYPELPTFDGSPRDWPRFITALVETTQEYGIPQSENISRLRKALRGQAEALVRGFLGSSSGVPVIVRYLRKRYGSSVAVLQALEDECAAMRPVAEDLDDVLGLMAKTEELVMVIRTYGELQRIQNPRLVHALFAKLPNHARSAFAMSGRCLADMDLEALIDWLDDLTAVALPQPIARASAPRPVLNTRVSETCKSLTPACAAGCGATHHLSICRSFAAMPPQERLRLTKRQRICWACLRKHRRLCNSPVRCHCGAMHHPLLHEAMPNVDTAKTTAREELTKQLLSVNEELAATKREHVEQTLRGEELQSEYSRAVVAMERLSQENKSLKEAEVRVRRQLEQQTSTAEKLMAEKVSQVEKTRAELKSAREVIRVKTKQIEDLSEKLQEKESLTSSKSTNQSVQAQQRNKALERRVSELSIKVESLQKDLLSAMEHAQQHLNLREDVEAELKVFRVTLEESNRQSPAKMRQSEEALKARVEDLRSDIALQKTEERPPADDVSDTTGKLTRARAELKQTRQKLSDTQGELRDSLDQMSSLKSELANLREESAVANAPRAVVSLRERKNREQKLKEQVKQLKARIRDNEEKNTALLDQILGLSVKQSPNSSAATATAMDESLAEDTSLLNRSLIEEVRPPDQLLLTRTCQNLGLTKTEEENRRPGG